MALPFFAVLQRFRGRTVIDATGLIKQGAESLLKRSMQTYEPHSFVFGAAKPLPRCTAVKLYLSI